MYGFFPPEEAVPMLLKLVTGSDAALAGEASSALGVVGDVEHLPPLTQIVLDANENGVSGQPAQGQANRENEAAPVMAGIVEGLERPGCHGNPSAGVHA